MLSYVRRRACIGRQKAEMNLGGGKFVFCRLVEIQGKSQ